MGMDHFMEEVVVKKKRTLDDIVYILTWPIIIFAAIYGMMMLSGAIQYIASGQATIGQLIPSIVLGLVNAAIAVLLYLYHDRLKTEYEYTFTNGDLDFAQVFNNKKRKSLGSLKMRNIEAFGPVTGSSFQRYISMPGIMKTNWFLNRDGNLHYFYFQKDSNKRIIVCEPSEEMVKMIRQYLPHGAYQD